MQILKQGKTPENFDLQAEEWQYKDGSKSYTIAVYPQRKNDGTARLFTYVPNEKMVLAFFDEFVAGTMTFAELDTAPADGYLGHIIRCTARGKYEYHI